MHLCCGAPEVNGDAVVKPAVVVNEDDDCELMSAPSLLMLAHKLDMNGQTASEAGFFDNFSSIVANAVSSGATSLTSTFTELPGTVTSSAENMTNFFSSLVSTPAANVAEPSNPSSFASDVSSASWESETQDADPQQSSVSGVDYRKYPLKGYVNLPSALQHFLNLPFLDHYLIVGRPTMAPSCGLARHRQVVPKTERAAAPFLIVIDKPGMLKDSNWKDEKYIWVEFLLGDVFMLDVSKMKTMNDYTSTLSKKGRWNFKDRQKKFKDPKLVKSELVPLAPGDRAMVDLLWPLYKQTGERNGFTVLTEEEFYDFHLIIPNLSIFFVYDVRNPENPKLVSFCTGVRWKDVLMPMWCGTDYFNDMHKIASTYFNMLYEYVAIAIADPAVNWVDLGASRRTAKTAIGFKPYPSAGYFRCKNTVMQAMVETMMEKFYEPERLINDP